MRRPWEADSATADELSEEPAAEVTTHRKANRLRIRQSNEWIGHLQLVRRGDRAHLQKAAARTKARLWDATGTIVDGAVFPSKFCGCVHQCTRVNRPVHLDLVKDVSLVKQREWDNNFEAEYVLHADNVRMGRPAEALAAVEAVTTCPENGGWAAGWDAFRDGYDKRIRILTACNINSRVTTGSKQETLHLVTKATSLKVFLGHAWVIGPPKGNGSVVLSDGGTQDNASHGRRFPSVHLHAACDRVANMQGTACRRCVDNDFAVKLVLFKKRHLSFLSSLLLNIRPHITKENKVN
jgi:hypothetical protein